MATLATWGSIFAVALVLGVAAIGIPAIAQETGNSGSIKVHDEPDEDPDTRNEPHVDCEDFWVQGFKMADDSGTLVFYAWEPTGNGEEVMTAAWTGTETKQKNKYDFLAGPFELPAGHYRVEAYLDQGHPGNKDHFAKATMFWVEPCDTSEVIECPTGLIVTAPESGGFLVSWTPAEGSDGSIVYRAVGEGDFEMIAFVAGDGDSYLDEDVEPGVTYTYTVTGLFGDRESTNCAEASMSMIPDFPTMFAVAAASIAGVAGYALVTRRRN